MGDETYKLPTNEEIRDMEMEQGVPVIIKPINTIEDRIALLESTISKQQKLINLCLEALERFGASHQASHQQFLDEFHRINAEDA